MQLPCHATYVKLQTSPQPTPTANPSPPPTYPPTHPLQGQSVVPPAEAQVIFSTVPLWSLAFAFLLLGGEPMSQYTLVGGAAVVAAGLIASRKPTDPAAESDKAAGKQA